jgi:protein phosphatase
MRLTKTAPQQALPDEAEQANWGNGYHGPGGHEAGDAGASGTDTAPGGHHTGRRGYDDDEDGYAQHHEGKRRWPIVTTLLVLLVLLIGGGLYGGWRYVQGQYYVGVQDGNVAIFRGINQNLAGISLSSLITRTGLPISQVVASNQGMIRQTIPASSLADARTLVGQIQSEVDNCDQKWKALVQWQTAETRYQAEVAAYRARKTRVPPRDNPGGQPPTPDAAGCAPASAFGIPATALPGGQPTAAPSVTATPTRPAVTPTAKASARATTKAAA